MGRLTTELSATQSTNLPLKQSTANRKVRDKSERHVIRGMGNHADSRAVAVAYPNQHVSKNKTAINARSQCKVLCSRAKKWRSRFRQNGVAQRRETTFSHNRRRQSQSQDSRNRRKERTEQRLRQCIHIRIAQAE